MPEWGWAVASAVVVIALVQIVAFYYLMKNGRDSSPWAATGRERGDTSPTRAGSLDWADGPGTDGSEGSDHDRAERFDEDTDVTRCGRCGAPNERDPMIKFCYNCGEEL